MENVKSISALALKRFGPENITLKQLSQVEDEGLWPPTGDAFFCDAPSILLDFIEARAVKVLRAHMEHALYYRQLPPDPSNHKLPEDIWTQMRHTK